MLRPKRMLCLLCVLCAGGVVAAGTATADSSPGSDQTSTALTVPDQTQTGPTVPRTTPTSTAAPAINAVASVNPNIHGVWPTAALAAAHDSTMVGAADANGCPSYSGCGWVNSDFEGDMYAFDQTQNFTTVYDSSCASLLAGSKFYNWNDCVSSIDNTETSGCYETWFYNINWGGTTWIEAPGVAHATLGSSNDNFSSSKYCTNSSGN
jgi:hypothetical protein